MRRLFYTLLVILALSTAASANTAIFNDETSFLSALQSGYYLEDFNNFTYGTYYYDPLGFGPTNGFSYRMSSPLRGLFSLDGKMANLESTETIIIDFTGSPSPVKAVGGNFWPTDIEGQNLAGKIDLSLSDGTQLNLTNADFTTFRGFISDGAAFTYMRISTGGGGTEISYPTVDHLYIGQPAPAPNQPPVALCQNVTVAAGSSCTASVSINNGSYDPDGDSITLTQSPAGPYPKGTTLVTLTVTDSKGASSQCTGTVTVVDQTPPGITSASVNPSALWPPNHKMVNVTINYNATDNCDQQPVCKISSVTSNESISNSDYTIVDAHQVKLLAEREGKGTGRVYTITITCNDTSGNSSNQSVKVNVPHDQGK